MSDKALAFFHGRRLLQRVVEASLRVTSDVILSVRSGGQGEIYRRSLGKAGRSVRVVVDEPLGCPGPLNGIATGLKAASGDASVVVPCDAPSVRSEVLALLLRHLDEATLSVPVWPDGLIEPMLFGARTPDGSLVANALCMLGCRKTVDFIRAAPSVKFVSVATEFMAVDPSLGSFVNVNYPFELRVSPPRRSLEGSLHKSFRVQQPANREAIERVLDFAQQVRLSLSNHRDLLLDLLDGDEISRSHFWSALLSRHTASLGTLGEKAERELLSASAEAYERERKNYSDLGLSMLEAHALLDEALVWRMLGEKELGQKRRLRAQRILASLGLTRPKLAMYR